MRFPVSPLWTRPAAALSAFLAVAITVGAAQRLSTSTNPYSPIIWLPLAIGAVVCGLCMMFAPRPAIRCAAGSAATFGSLVALFPAGLSLGLWAALPWALWGSATVIAGVHAEAVASEQAQDYTDGCLLGLAYGTGSMALAWFLFFGLKP